MLYKGVGFPDPATVHCTVESSYSSGQLSFCHRPKTECHIADRPPLSVLCVVFVIASLSEEAVQELELRSHFISALLADWYRFTGRYIEDVLMVRLSLSGHCGNK